MDQSRDFIYAKPHNEVADFQFDEQVAHVFPDMINRSVPGYQTIVHNIGRLAAHFVQPHTRLYDLGCSLGAATIAMKQQCAAPGIELIGVDNSPAMVERCRQHVQAFRGDIPVAVECADISDYKLADCSVVVLNFTLQFIPPEQRRAIIEHIFAALKPGGLLVLSEKVRHDDPVAEAALVDLHHGFKRDNGYSELEISQKRAALEHVMQLDSAEAHEGRLRAAGFSTVQAWFRCFNFTSWLAVK